MNAIIEQQINYARKSAMVNVDSLFGWVSITDKDDIESDIFLQGDEAYQFITSARDLYETDGTISMDDAYYINMLML